MSPSSASRYIGRHLHELGGDVLPAAVIDIGIARRNCQLMRDAACHIDINFRPHVKSHKTTELTRCQVSGSEDNHTGHSGNGEPVRLVVSTVAEIEQLVPYLLERRSLGHPVDVYAPAFTSKSPYIHS